jgi:hypothetical protein
MKYKVLIPLVADKKYQKGDIITNENLLGTTSLYLTNNSIELIEEKEETKKEKNKCKKISLCLVKPTQLI